MTTTAFAGPLVAFGAASSSESNPDRGPSLFDQGYGILDSRNYQGADAPRYGWLSTGDIPLISQVSSTAAVNNIGASAVPVSGTPFTLVSSTAAGITVGASVVNALTGQTVTGLLAIDGAAGVVNFSGGPVNLYDPTKALARAVRIVSAGNDSSGTFLISGYDVYGYPMTQLLTGANAGTATTTVG